MTIVNHEVYVSFEVAKLLKEAGFDWECHGIYVLDSENDPEYVFSTATFTNTSKEIEGYIRFSAPTLDIAQRWLREVKNTDLYVWCHSYGGVVTAYDYSSYHSLRADDGEIMISQGDEAYDTYEQALEAGILKCLTLLLEQLPKEASTNV